MRLNEISKWWQRLGRALSRPITRTRCAAATAPAAPELAEHSSKSLIEWWRTQSISNASQQQNSLLTGKLTGKIAKLGSDKQRHRHVRQ